ncbi:MAG: ParB/RepB/Spo0J family partition protein [Bacteroidia bacterium]
MAKTRKALGRGLEGLLPTNLPAGKPEVAAVTTINLIPVDQIDANPFQPRHDFDNEALKELADSIREQGIIQPLTVRRLADKQYQLIAGERRLKASKIAGLKEVPAYIRTANDEQMLEMALIENIQREDLNPIEIALSYQRMIDEIGLRQEDLGDKVGKNRASVSNYLRLLKLPPTIMSGLKSKLISFGHGRTLISIENPILQEDIFNEIISKGLSVRQTEEMVRQANQPKEKKTATPEKPSSDQILLQKVAADLTRKFARKIKLQQNKDGKGEITIPFDSSKDLNTILEILDI